MKECNDIEFISTYWNELKAVCDRIKKELPKKESQGKKISKKLKIISYKDLDNWDAGAIIKDQSNNLIALADKITHMINKGQSPNILPMLKRMCYKGVKKQSQPNAFGRNDFLGHGHFRWNHSSYELNDKELQKIKKYFNL